MGIIEKLSLFFNGAKLISTDYYDNNYYVLSEKDVFGRNVRYVQYSKKRNASNVPPLWNGWLRYTIDTETLQKEIKATQPKFVKFHRPDLTGTNVCYTPLQNLNENIKKSQNYNSWLD
jgi:NADH:ubiquinone oxidoreductase subunit